jgi:hypothetical protein
MLAKATRHLHKLFKELSLKLYKQEENVHGDISWVLDDWLNFSFEVLP